MMAKFYGQLSSVTPPPPTPEGSSHQKRLEFKGYRRTRLTRFGVICLMVTFFLVGACIGIIVPLKIKSTINYSAGYSKGCSVGKEQGWYEHSRFIQEILNRRN